MHKYFVEIYKYTSRGALEPRPFTTLTADNELQLRTIRDKYAYEMQTDDDGNPTFKMYKIKVSKLQYQQIADIDAEINVIFSSL